jgi:hypothetical protein
MDLGAGARVNLDRLNPLVFLRPVGALKYLYGMVPGRRDRELSSISKTASGVPIDQPSANFGATADPCRRPSARRHRPTRRSVSISFADRRGSFLNMPCGVSAPHGGIAPETTRCLIDRAHGRASSNVVSDIGANIVGRWHSTQLLLKIGATSFVNVGAALPSAAKAAGGQGEECGKNEFSHRLILPYGELSGS